MGDCARRCGLVLVSRSMPPDIGGYQRQFTLLMPDLVQRFGPVSWIGAVRDAPLAGPAPAKRLAVPAHRLPRRTRGGADVVVIVAACLLLLWRGIRRRPGTLLLLSPTMVGGPLMIRAAALAGWSTAARFPTPGDQLAPRGRRVGTLSTAANLVPSPGQTAEQRDFLVVPVVNAVETSVPRPAARSSLDGRFLFLGRLVGRKRPDLVIEAWQAICDELPGWSICFVGAGGSERDSIEDEVRRHAESGRVPRCTFLGSVQDPTPLILDSDVFVFPSLSEGLPNSMLESLALGLPVIADASLAKEWFGRPVPLLPWDGKPTSLADAMRRAATDPDLREEVGAAGASFVAEHHAPGPVADQLYEAIGNTARQRAGGRLFRGRRRAS